MALKLNLHHEIDMRKALKKRDPLKFAAGGVIAIVAGFAIYYLIQFGEAHSMSQEFAVLEQQLKSLEPKAAAAKKHEDELNEAIKASQAMVKKVEGRFYWAPVIASIAAIVPREVQVTALIGDVDGGLLKRGSVTIEGIATGAEPRKTAEDLRKAVADCFAAKYRKVNASFKRLDESSEAAKLDGHALPTVDFAIQVSMETGEEPPPPPAPYIPRRSRT